MACEFCNGSGRLLAIVTHPYTQKKKTLSIPCVCFTSSVVSSEYSLLKHLGEQYLHPDKLDPNLQVDFDDLSVNENMIFSGDYDTLLLMVKALIMKYRFDPRRPRILFSRSIDIVHDYHVPQKDDESAPHLSATSIFDLIIIIFGTLEKNKALASCMTQVVQTRVNDKKPTWIYFPETMPTLNNSNQEFSPELVMLLEKFKKIEINSGMKITKSNSISKNIARMH